MAVVSVAPFDFVVFGGTGDLAQRKLLPALFMRDRDGQISADSRIFSISRRPVPDYAREVEAALREHVKPSELDQAVLDRFLRRLTHVAVDAASDEGWPDLVRALSEGDDPARVRVHYMATSPNLFGPICEALGRHGLADARTRVVLEKPIGHDLESARATNDQVNRVFDEAQIFRIDHYLGKETVQNLLALRFANALFEPLWNASAIDHVQITVAEKLGVEGRGGYYDHAGALSDMVQNHLLQLLCLVAMEPPRVLDKEAVRDEKIKVLRALAPITRETVGQATVRGQYRAGAIDGQSVRGYLDEQQVAEGSQTETFVALKLELKNWRWAGVPFYLRTGKRLQQKVSEIVIQFRPVPHRIFPADAGPMQANRLVMRLQPDEHIRLLMMTKEPGPGGVRLKAAPLNLSFAETFKQRFPDAYERLLMDVVRGNPTLFMRRDEVEAAWAWSGTILDAWAQADERPRPYISGTWGPSQAIALIERDGRTWYDETLEGA